MTPVSMEGEDLVWGARRVHRDRILGFRERHSGWTGRTWVDVRGTGWQIPIDAGYAATRATLRAAAPDRPFEADWSDGTMPPAPLGVPGDLATAAASFLVLLVSVIAAWKLGAATGAAVVGVAGWPIARLRDAVVLRRDGMRVGPAWSPVVSWADVDAVCYAPAGRVVRVWLRGTRSPGGATLPAALLPVLRARVRRLGGLEIQRAEPTTDDRYAAWIAPASGIPWGLLVATGLATAWTQTPWRVLGSGLLAVAATALLGAAVEARATGWGTGAVIFGTAVYAVVLAAVGLGVGGWLTP